MPSKNSKIKVQKSSQSVRALMRAKIQVKVQKSVKPVVARKTSGLTVDVLNAKGKVVGRVSLPKEIFAAKINQKLVAQAVRVYLANQRQGTVSTKTRGEVRGSTRKIYRQKGTGRARHGSIRAPIFVHGGIVFGPKPRDFSLSLPKNMRKGALFSTLTSKLKEKKMKVIDGIEKVEAKTKHMAGLMKNVGFSRGASVLLVLPKEVGTVTRASRNIQGLDVRFANMLTAYDVLSHRDLLIAKKAIALMEETWIK